MRTLGEVTTLIKRGRAPSYADEGIAVVSQKCVLGGDGFAPNLARRTDPTVKPIPEWAYLRAGDVLVNSTGRGTLGRACLVRHLGEPTTADSHVSIVRVDERRVTPKFVGAVLSSGSTDLEALQSGSTSQTELSPAALGSFPLAIPSLPEQRRIVDLIGALDAQSAALAAEERAGRAMLVALRRMYFEPLDGTLDLTSVMLKVMSGGTPNRKRPEFYGGDIPWLKSGEVASPWIASTEEKITEDALAGSSAWVVPAGAVVVAMYGATAAEVGFLAEPMATNQAVLALVPNKDRCDGRFAYHWLQHHSPRLKAAASGAAQPNLSKAVILRETRYPDLGGAEQVSIGQILDAPLATADLLTQERLSLRLVRSAVVDQLLRGRVEIPESYDALFEAV